MLEDERSSLAGAGAVEVFDSRATPPYGAERINRASEMTENPHTHAIVSMAVIEYSVEVRLPPSPSEPTLVVRHCFSNAFLCPWLVDDNSISARGHAHH